MAKKAVLLDVLGHEDDEVVLASAIEALVASSPVELDDGLIARLLEHPSDRVQRSAKQFLGESVETLTDGATIDVE